MPLQHSLLTHCRAYQMCQEPTRPKNPSQPTGDLNRAWKGLQSLDKGMQAEFQRFSNVTAETTSSALCQLRARFPSSKTLANQGILVYRDVLEGFLPDTLGDIFAFASLSHAVSEILVRRKRMKKAEILSGLQRWKNCIRDAAERDTFATLASGMWPQASAFSPQREPVSTFNLGHEGHGDHNIPDSEGQDISSQFLREVAAIASAEMGHLSSNLSDPGQPGTLPANLEQDVLKVTNLTEQEFDFSLLRNLSTNNGGGYAALPAIDPRVIEWFCDPDQPIPSYSPPPIIGPTSPCVPAWAGLPVPDFPSQTPLPLPTPRSPSSCRGLYEFRLPDKISDCPIMNLRNTGAFLAVLAFVREAGESFYLLSGSGMTVARCRTGSASASERSKTERKLRREIFDPLKRAGAEDPSFLALLAVAKKFVVLGSLGTKEEVESYLFTVSKVT